MALKIGTLTDDFSFADTAKWTRSGTAAVTSGQLRLPCDASYSASYQSVATYDLTGSAAYVQMQAPNLGNGSTEAGLTLDNGNNREFIFYSGGSLILREAVAGVNSDTSVTYDPVAHAWLRIRESGGTIFWETSPDGYVWAVQRSKAAGIAVTSLAAHMFSGFYGTEPNPGAAVFDNFNVNPPAYSYRPPRIPNRNVGPPVLRRLFRQPITPQQKSAPPQAQPGTPPVKVPNPFVGPPALRRKFRFPRRSQKSDVYNPPPTPVGGGTPPANPLALQCQQIWSNSQAARQAEINLRQTTPLVRVWDGNWNLQFANPNCYDGTFAWIVNDSGPGRTEIPYTDPCAQWIADDVSRVASGQGRNVHITVDYCGARWGGRMDKFSIEQRADGDTVLVVDWLHDYENLKWYTVWCNPFFPAEFQFPRAFLLPGPVTWILKLSLFLQLLREHNPLIILLDDPLSLLQPSSFLSLDMSTWHIVVKPQSLLDAINSGVVWGVVSSRFANWHDMSHTMLEDAQLSVTCTRYLPGDPPPWPGANLRYGTLVVDLVDQSGIFVGTSNGGNLFDGLIRTVETFSQDFADSTLAVLTDTQPPSGYYIPNGNKYTDPRQPYVVYKQGTNTPIETSSFIVSPHKGLQITVGGHSMPGVNEVISASIQAGFGVLGSLVGLGSLGSTIDTLVKPLYEDTVLAWWTAELFSRFDAGWDYYFEYFQSGANKAYTLASLMVLRAGAWATRNFVSWKVTAIDGLPYTVGDRGQGHFFIGDRVGLVLQGDPHQRIWMDRVRKIDLKFKDDAWPEWDLTIGDDRILQDPAQRAFGQIESLIAGLRDLGVW